VGVLVQQGLCRLAVQHRYAATGLQARLPADHGLFVGLKAGIDDRHARAELCYLDGAVFDCSVRLDHIDIATLRALLHRGGGNRQRVLASFDQQPDIDQFARPQPMLGIGEIGLEPYRAAGLDDLVVQHRELALVELGLIVFAVGQDGQRSFRHRLLDLREAGLGKGENHRDRLELGDHHQTVRIGRCTILPTSIRRIPVTPSIVTLSGCRLAVSAHTRSRPHPP